MDSQFILLRRQRPLEDAGNRYAIDRPLLVVRFKGLHGEPSIAL